MVGEGTVRVLIIDSVPKDVELFSEALSRLPFHSLVIESSSTGQEGLEKARRTRYDLILLDSALPGTDGLELLQTFREENLAHVVMLARKEDRSAPEYLKRGALDYILKEDLPRIDLQRMIDRAFELMRLKQATYELERLNVMKNEFLGIVSQELKTPMTVVVGMANMLLSGSLGPLNDEQKRCATQILQQGQGLSRLIEDLLELKARTLGSRWLNPKALSLGDLIKETIGTMERYWRGKGLNVELEPFAEPYYMDGDAGKLSEMIIQILANAIKFTPSNGTIKVKAQRLGPGEVEIAIEDSGQGMEKEDLDHLFDRFNLPDVASGPTPSGLGLGLVFCREVVEAHHGRMRVDSPGKGQGARVSVILPCPEQEKAAAPVGAKKVLLVDDNRDVLELLKFLLRHNPEGPLDLLTAPSGEKALQMAAAEHPKLIVLDVMLGGMDGLEVLEVLKKSPQTRGIPVLILTAFPDGASRALTLGASAILIKPFPPDKLLQKVKNLLKEPQGVA